MTRQTTIPALLAVLILATSAACIEEPEEVGSDRSESMMWGGSQVGVYVPPPARLLYAFDGNAHDSSPYRNNGWAVGVTNTTNRFGQANRALEFSGTDMVWVPYEERFDMTNYTLSAFVYISQHPPESGYHCDYYALIDKRSHFSFRLTQCGGATHMGLSLTHMVADRPTSDGFHSSYAQIRRNEWTHVAVTRSNNTLTFYVNGRLTESKSNVSVARFSNDNVLIGRTHYGKFFDGKMDDVRIHPRALSDSEVFAMYQQGN